MKKDFTEFFRSSSKMKSRRTEEAGPVTEQKVSETKVTEAKEKLSTIIEKKMVQEFGEKFTSEEKFTPKWGPTASKPPRPGKKTNKPSIKKDTEELNELLEDIQETFSFVSARVEDYKRSLSASNELEVSDTLNGIGNQEGNDPEEASEEETYMNILRELQFGMQH